MGERGGVREKDEGERAFFASGMCWYDCVLTSSRCRLSVSLQSAAPLCAAGVVPSADEAKVTPHTVLLHATPACADLGCDVFVFVYVNVHMCERVCVHACVCMCMCMYVRSCVCV